MTQGNGADAWQGVKRSDGVLIVQTFLGSYFILPADEAPAIDRCPSCGAAMLSEQAAQLVADHCLPLPSRLSMTTENDMPENSDHGRQNGKC